MIKTPNNILYSVTILALAIGRLILCWKMSWHWHVHRADKVCRTLRCRRTHLRWSDVGVKQDLLTLAVAGECPACLPFTITEGGHEGHLHSCAKCNSPFSLYIFYWESTYLTPQREPGHGRRAFDLERMHFWEFWPPRGSLVTEEGLLIPKGCIFENSDSPEEAWSQRRVFNLNKMCFLIILTPRREPGHRADYFLGILGPYGSMWAEILSKCIVYKVSSCWNICWTNVGPGKYKSYKSV